MADRVLLIDLENVQKIDLSAVTSDVRVLVFYGVAQKKLPEELVIQAQPLGTRLTWIKISGNGPNALDFHIAFYLGQELTHRPTCECTVCSRDTGFDPLIQHLLALGHRCRRVNSLRAAVFAGAAQPPELEHDHFGRLISLLTKEKTRPTKRKGLVGKVKSWFPKLSESERSGLVQRLLGEAYVCERVTCLPHQRSPDLVCPRNVSLPGTIESCLRRWC